MFDGLKRKFIFGKIAAALEGLRSRDSSRKGDGKVLGWSMTDWKKWGEGLALSALGGGFAAALTYWQTCSVPGDALVCSWKGIGAAFVGGALAALVAWFRMSPSDPRRAPIPPAEGEGPKA